MQEYDVRGTHMTKTQAHTHTHTHTLAHCMHFRCHAIFESQLSRASVVVVVYGADSKASFESVKSFWLPMIKKVSTESTCFASIGLHFQSQKVHISGSHVDVTVPVQTCFILWCPISQHTASSPTPVPVVLNRNKVDVDSRGAAANIPEEETPLVKECWPLCDSGDVAVAVETSAKEDMAVADLFHAAVSAVLYPLAPIYDNDTRMLNARTIRALTRIFTIYDVGKDGLLDDEELNNFQTSVPLGPHFTPSSQSDSRIQPMCCCTLIIL